MVGLTGGIAAGKSVVARRLARCGAVVIDADKLSREVVAPGTEGLREVVAAFGEEVLGAGGALDRAALGRRVFADDAARRRLESIIHPRVRERTIELAAAAAPDAVIVNDVPLLVESGLAARYHLVVVVTAAEETRIARLARDRGMGQAEAYARIRAQASDERRQAAADVLLTNDGEIEDLELRVDRLWTHRLLPFEENVRLRRPARPKNPLPVVPYDPTWPRQYARLAARIAHAAGTGRLEHIGPTAVPGRPAADLIDIRLTVDTLAAADWIADALAAAGFPRAAVAPDGVRWHGGADPGRLARLAVSAAAGG